MNTNQITQYDDVNEILNILSQKLQSLLADNLVGIYLHGSLALGDFDPATSDVDFMVVIQNKLNEDQVEAVNQIHQNLIEGENEWGKKLEGSYVTVEQLKSEEPPFDPRPYLNEKTFYAEADYGYEWVLEKYATREKGLVLYGPDPKELIERVEVDDVLAAVKKIFEENWQPMITNPEKLESEWYQPYTILTMCRMMYAQEKGQVGSKKEAAEWMMENFGDRWGDLVNMALKWKRGESFGRLHDVVGMIKYVSDFLK